MLKTIPFGSVVSWRINPKDLTFPENLFDYAQNFFTKMPETHASIILTPLVNWPIPTWYEYEASNTTRINLYNITPVSSIFNINAPEDVKIKIMQKLITNTYGKIYAIPQTLYFIIRWAVEGIGLDPRKWINPFHWGKICSELVYDYLFDLSQEMKWYDLEDQLKQWRPDNFHAGDVRVILNWMEKHSYSNLIYGI